jgi:biliverdin reductase
MGHTRAVHLAQDDRATLTCVSSRNAITGRVLADRHGVAYVEDWREAVTRADVDAVFVTTHNDSHAPIAATAIAAGKHVFVEYPLATSLADADRLLAAARAGGVRVQVGHDQAAVGWHLAIKEAAGTLGKLLAVNSVLATPSRGGGRSVWRNKELSGPPFMVGIAYVYHLLDLFGPVDWVEGTSTYDALDETGYYRSSVSTLTVEFAQGGVAQLLYIRGFAVPRDEQEQAMMFGNGFLSYRGYVSGSRTNEGFLTRVTHGGPQRIDFPQVTLAQASRQNTARFLDALAAGTIEDPRALLAREAVAVALAAEQAAQEGTRIQIRRAEL